MRGLTSHMLSRLRGRGHGVTELCAVDRYLADEVLGLTGAPVVADIATGKPADEPLQRSGSEDAALSVLALDKPAAAAKREDAVLDVRRDVVTDALLATSGDNNVV